MATFTLLSLGITAAVLQSRRLSQLNVLRTSAYTVAQGYMEQIFSINPADLETASETWVNGRAPIPTEAVNSLTANAALVEKSDPLFVSPYAAPYPTTWNGTSVSIIARNGTGLTNDIWNCKQIMIDLTTNSTGGNASPIVMNEWFDIQVSRSWTTLTVGNTTIHQIPQSPAQPGYFLVKLDFQFSCPGWPTVGNLTGSLRMSRSEVSGP